MKNYSSHQSQYFAWQLTRRLAAESQDKLTGAIMDAQIDLNPHQVDAALFSFRNPLSKGVILADEVGLGKTIEAGLVIAQKWAEHRRRILIIVPANLRKQWHQELQEKFGVDGLILDGDSYKTLKKEGLRNPFDQGEKIVICSYQFAKAKADDIKLVPWDLAVIDEAHRLRNVYKKSNKTAQVIKDTLAQAQKVLLTATPLQNSLLELYGLVSIIDETLFGDLDSFRIKYSRINDNLTFADLKKRIQPVCKRTLRKDVQQYVSYTKRIPLVEEFTPSSDEQELYAWVSDYLRRPNLNALPSGQRQLISMVMWKLLASSSFAIAGALDSLIKRLENNLPDQELMTQISENFETLDETADEWQADEDAASMIAPEQIESIQDELNELKVFRELARNIRNNAKGKALLTALERAFQELAKQGAEQKAIIFTESKRTQEYLRQILAETEYGKGLVLFNGENNSIETRQIYQAWLKKHQNSDKITGSKTSDTRAALVEYFKEQGSIMIATEAAAEGVNLQFCSLVINYDLPWNPQRIEQRIGRCHRYGQKHDVVVLNFIDLSNEADKRVHELLQQKFTLFDGVFGASDEVLGAIGSGVDFEKRIKQIYESCRQPEEIEQAFAQLQSDLAHEINVQMVTTREQLFENFDEDVLQRIKIDTEASLDKYETMLLNLTQSQLAEFILPIEGGFVLNSLPKDAPANIPLGEYELPRRDGEQHIYRLGHPLAQWLIEHAKNIELQPAHLLFDTRLKDTKVSVIEQLKGQQGQLQVVRFSVESMQRTEDHLILCGLDEQQNFMNAEVLEKLLNFPVAQTQPAAFEPNSKLQTQLVEQKAKILQEISQRNLAYFELESEKLDNWADDLKANLEQEIKEIDRDIKEVRRTAKTAGDLNEKLHWQKRQKELEKQRNKKRRELFDRQDDVDEKRESLIEQLERKLQQTTQEQDLFMVTWQVI
ncbi:MAG: SNF2-related protein [Thiomicrospira sp.]